MDLITVDRNFASMAVSAALQAAKRRLFASVSSLSSSPLDIRCLERSLSSSSISFSKRTITAKSRSKESKRKENSKSRVAVKAAAVDSALKRRTPSGKEFDEETILKYGSSAPHIPVMLGKILHVFSCWKPLRSFVDCTVGAAGHSLAMIQAHPELQLYVGMDVDPVAHENARARIDPALDVSSSSLKIYTVLKNFRDIKSVVSELDEGLLNAGVDGILMDLGVSSMQVDNPKRGFCVLNNGPLEMRMDPKVCLGLKVHINCSNCDKIE